MPTAICGYLKCLWNLTILLTVGSKSKLRFVLLTDILAQFSGNERFECKSGFGAIAFGDQIARFVRDRIDDGVFNANLHKPDE